MKAQSVDSSQVTQRLTIAHFIHATDAQAGLLCGYSKGNGHHVKKSNPTMERIRTLAYWFDDDLETALRAVSQRKKEWNRLKKMTPEERVEHEAAIAVERKRLRAEINAAIAMKKKVVT